MLKKLFYDDIENIKNAKSDTDNKLSLLFAKTIKAIPIGLLHQNMFSKEIEHYRRHDTV